MRRCRWRCRRNPEGPGTELPQWGSATQPHLTPSQKHRIIQLFELEGTFNGHLVQRPCSKQGHPQLRLGAQSSIHHAELRTPLSLVLLVLLAPSVRIQQQCKPHHPELHQCKRGWSNCWTGLHMSRAGYCGLSPWEQQWALGQHDKLSAHCITREKSLCTRAARSPGHVTC